MKFRQKISHLLSLFHNEYEAIFFGTISHLLLIYCFFNVRGSIFEPNTFFWLFYLSFFLEALVILSLFLKEDISAKIIFSKDFFILIATIIFWCLAAYLLNIYLASLFSLAFCLNMSGLSKKRFIAPILILTFILILLKLLAV